MKKKIITFIKEHKFSTAEISDALGKQGSIEDVEPIIKGLYFVGELFYTYAYAESNWFIHNDIVHIPKNSIVFIENLDKTNKALFGEIVSRFIFEKKEAIAIVTNGKIRDKKDILNFNVPIWHIGTNPTGCYNNRPVFTDSLDILAQERKKELKNSILICDDDGVIIIKEKDINDTLFTNLKKLREQEKIWKECVFKKGWNTFDTICLRRYQENEKS